ncbi:MAG: PIG-L deacetylase family protein [Jatrophihabitans sp.]
MSFRLVSFHAHPDDEALLTAGTLARAAAEGHRVTLVVATAGEAGLSDSRPGTELAARRLAELRRSAAAIGCVRVVELGYPDSGMHGEHDGFGTRPVAEPAARLAEILAEERADALTVYDRNGGYGHPDHVQVHRVGHRAAELAGTALVLEATVDRTALLRALWLLHRTRLAPPDFAPERMRTAYTDRARITHRVDVRGYLDQKRAAMRAHATQAAGGSDTRTLAYCLKLPRPLYRLAFGTEWFLEPGRAAGAVSGDIFASLR